MVCKYTCTCTHTCKVLDRHWVLNVVCNWCDIYSKWGLILSAAQSLLNNPEHCRIFWCWIDDFHYLILIIFQKVWRPRPMFGMKYKSTHCTHKVRYKLKLFKFKRKLWRMCCCCICRHMFYEEENYNFFVDTYINVPRGHIFKEWNGIKCINTCGNS